MSLSSVVRRLGGLAIVGALAACASVSLPWPLRSGPEFPQRPANSDPPRTAGDYTPREPAETLPAAGDDAHVESNNPSSPGAMPLERSTPHIAAPEKIALIYRHELPQVEFRPPARIEWDAPKIMMQSITVGAAAGGVPLIVCVASYLCTPEGLLAGAALLVAGTAAGVVVGAGRVIADGKLRPPSQPPALDAADIEATAPVIRSAAERLLRVDVRHECMGKQMTINAAGDTTSTTWTHEARSAAVVLRHPRPGVAAAPHAAAVEDDYQYVIETFVSRVALLPVGNAGRDPRDVPAHLLVEGGLRFLDRKSNREHERTFDWRSDSRTLSEWRAEEKGLLAESLRIACESLAAQIAATAKTLWQTP